MSLGKITINNVEFSKYSDYFVLNEIVYVKEPVRSNDGSMPDISSLDRFVVPRIFIDFNYLDIGTYRSLLNATSNAEFPIQYYDVDTQTTKTAKFYLKPIERNKLYTKPQIINNQKEVVEYGIVGLSLEFVGTLND